jgi:hypothetical protein
MAGNCKGRNTSLFNKVKAIDFESGEEKDTIR